MGISDRIKLWIASLQLAATSPALPRMQLGPDESSENPLMFQFFTWEAKHPDMSWWDYLADAVPGLAELGVTQDGQGYDAYDLWDLGEFHCKGAIATRWGTKKQLIRACSFARNHGIGIIIDAVLNHKVGADSTETFTAVRVDPQNRLREIEPERKIRGWTVFDFPARRGKYSDMKWTQEHFTGLDFDVLTQTHGIYRITTKGHKGWSARVSTELGNYDYLLGVDIDHRHPMVRKDLLRWGSWVLGETNASGFRLDAIKHMDREFLLEFIKEARKGEIRQKLFCVSECWSADIHSLLRYVRAFEGQTAFFDVPLHANFHRASKDGPSYDLRCIFDNTLVALRPGDAVTFVDNHDTQIGQSLESWVDKGFKAQAYALILLRPNGLPCVFYGDMYPNQECYDHDTAAMLRQLVLARKRFAHGLLVDYFEHKNCIGFVRLGDSKYPGCVVVVSTNCSSFLKQIIRMHVGKHAAGETYCSFFDESRQLTIDCQGWGEFHAHNNSVDVWVASKDLALIALQIPHTPF